MAKLTFKQEMRIYDTIIILGLLGMTLWVVLKMMGVINTPPLILYLRDILNIVTLGAVLVKIVKYFHEFETTLRTVKHGIETLNTQTSSTNKRVAAIERKFDEYRQDYRAHLVKYHA